MPNFRQRPIGEQRRADIERIDQMSVKVTDVSGLVLVSGAGELAVPINFPVMFIEMPIMNFGASLDENEFATTGRYPTVDCCVISWVKDRAQIIAPGFTGYYRGCQLAVYLTGKSTQRIWVHWTASARAIRNPVNSVGSVDSEI